MNKIDIHPEIEEFWKKSGYDTVNCINNKHDRAARWVWFANNSISTVIKNCLTVGQHASSSIVIAVADFEDASDIKYCLGSEFYSAEYMLKVIKLISFI